MIDAGHELDNLRTSLIAKGASPEIADSICSSAAHDIRDAVIDLVSEALEQAVEKGGEKSSVFLSEIMAVRDGNLFNITTKSGRSDFSEPPFPMLPKLLQNAKVGYEGRQYKRIPIKQKIETSGKSKTIERALANINKQREILKAEKDARIEAQRGHAADPASDISSITTDISLDEMRNQVRQETNATQFRTASSLQDPSSKWVIPAKKADMSSELDSINNSLHNEIDNVIREIITNYRGGI